MQKTIKLITVSLLVFILGIFYLSLNRSSNYDTKFLVGNKLADIELKDGSVVTAHCPNTGPMKGLIHKGAKVRLS